MDSFERGLDQHRVSGAPLASFGCRKRTHSETSIVSFSHHGEGWKLTHLQRRRGRHQPRRGASLRSAPSRRRSPRSGARARARRRILGQLHERDLFLGEPTRFEDAPLALLSTVSTSDSVLRRLSNSSLAASVVSWSGDFVHQPVLHSPESSSSRIAALSEASRQAAGSCKSRPFR